MLSRLYKLIIDLGVCCSLGAFLLYYFGKVTLHEGGFLILLAAATLTLMMREKSKQSILFVIVLPVLGGLILRISGPQLLVYLPVWGYIVYLLVSDRLVVTRGDFLDRVRRILILSLILPLFMLVELSIFGEAFRAALPYLVVTIVSIVFMLRHLRTLQRREGQKGYYSQQLWEMIIFLAVCVMLTIARVPQNLLVGIRVLYQNLILPVLSLLGFILGTIISLIISLLSIEGCSRGRETSPRDDDLYGRLKDIPELTKVTVPSSVWLLPLLYSLGVILALIVLFFFIRWLIGDKGKYKIPLGVSEIRETLEEPNERKNNLMWRLSKEPAERIRYYYLKYLLYLHSIKISILSGDTTREVDQKYSDTLADPSCKQ
ncbi:MAG: hypothetical protein K0R34_3543, partial [Herbinix sp.]|nr:hypothetical protein [Herbinix sp.]